MDDHLRVCRCFVSEDESPGPGQGCMGPRVKATKSRQHLCNISRGKGRKKARYLPPLSSSPTWDGKEKGRNKLRQNSGEGIDGGWPNTKIEAIGGNHKQANKHWIKSAVTASDRTDTLGEESSECGSCISGWSGLRSVSAASLGSTADSLGSIDSINSLESHSFSVETFPLGEELSEISDGRLKRLGVVERTLFESWRGLPWQTRLCPRAIQNQEDTRRAYAMKKENRRVNAWRRKQQALALETARSEEERLSALWKAGAIKLWEHDAKLWRAQVQLVERHERHLATLEHERAELLSIGYGRELATLDRMDSSRHAERRKQIDSLFDIFSSGVGSIFLPTVPGSATGDPVTPTTPRVQEEPSRTRQVEMACIAQMSDGRDEELERGLPYVSAVSAAARVSSRRESLAHLIFRGLAAMYHDARAHARRKFASECAAELARVKIISASDRHSISVDNEEFFVQTEHDAGWERERYRATAEIKKEASFTTRWSRLQRAVLRKSTGEVLRLLTIDSLRQAYGDGGERGDRVTECIKRVRRRARRTLAELRAQQVEAEAEAKSVQWSWMAALAQWKSQLERSRVTAAGREADELRVVHKEKEEALAVRACAVNCALVKRRQVLAQSWGSIFGLERDRVNDASRAWRHCFVIAWAKLKELLENARCDYDRMEKYSQDKWALELERSQALAETIDEERRRLEHQQSLFVMTLRDIVADVTVEEVDAVASARHLWWQEARKGFLALFSAAVDTLSYGGDHPTEEAFDADASDSTRARYALVAGLDGMICADDVRSATAMAAIVSENGPLRGAETEQQQRCGEAIARCHSALDATVEHRSRPSNNALEATKAFGASGDDSAPLHPDVHEDLHQFRSRLEEEAVERATASLEGEVTRLAMEAKEEPCPSQSDIPSELTRSQLDLRRVARVRAGSKALGNMLFRAHDVILEAQRDSTEANEEDFSCNVFLSASRQLRTIFRIQDNARDNRGRAFRAALEKAHRRTQSILRSSRVASGKRRRSIQLAREWLDKFVDYERDRSARRLRQQAKQDAARTASLTALNRSLSRQQQECAVRVRQGGKDSLEAARYVFAEQVDEIIRQKREEDPDLTSSSRDGGVVSRGDGVVASTALSTSEAGNSGLPVLGIQSDKIDQNAREGHDLTNSSLDDGVVSPCDEPAASTVLYTSEVKDGGLPVLGIHPDEIDQNTREGSPSAAETASEIVTRNVEEKDTYRWRDTPFPPLEDINKVEASAILAAAEASLLVAINSWARSAESQARAWSEKLLSNAIIHEAEEKRTAESESEALRSVFHAAQEEAKQVFSTSIADEDPRNPAAGTETERADAMGDHATETDQCLGGFIAAEWQECARLWSSLEQALFAWLRDAIHRAQRDGRLQEEAHEFGEGATAYVEDLKFGLGDVFEETTKNARGELEEILIAGRKKLKLTLFLIEEEFAVIRKEKERAAARTTQAVLDTEASEAGVEETGTGTPGNPEDVVQHWTWHDAARYNAKRL